MNEISERERIISGNAYLWYVRANGAGVVVGSLIALALGLGAVSLLDHHADGLLIFRATIYATSAALALGLAALLIGSVLGIVFGIPRSNTANGASASVRYLGNTSLEQISDWLTKIIVGVGLVELAKIPPLLSALGSYAANAFAWAASTALPAIRGPALGSVAGLDAAALGMLGYFFVLGFLGGYFFARLWLPQVLPFSERAILEEVDPEARDELRDADLSPEHDGLGKVSKRAAQAAEALRKIPMAAMRSPDELRAWAKAKLAVGQADSALSAFQVAASESPTDSDVLRDLGYASLRTSKPITAGLAFEDAAKLAGTKEVERADLLNAIRAHLRAVPPAGFENALRVVESSGIDDAEFRALKAQAHEAASEWYRGKDEAKSELHRRDAETARSGT